MKEQYIRLIAEQDRVLASLREIWLEVAPVHKQKHLDRIDAALDERLRLMALRDSAPS